MKARRDGHMAVVASGSAPLDVPSVLGFNSSGDSIIMRFIENGDPVWRLLSLKDQAWSPPLAKSETFSKAILDRKSGRIIAGAHGTDDDRYFFFDNEMQAHWDAVAAGVSAGTSAPHDGIG